MMGRPRKEFDWDLFNTLCGYPSVVTQEDIAEAMKCSVDTLSNRIKEEHGDITFSEYRVKKQGALRRSILTWQLEAAKRGNPTILIWLGKNYLNQKEPTFEQEVTLKDEDKTAKDFALQLNQAGAHGSIIESISKDAAGETKAD